MVFEKLRRCRHLSLRGCVQLDGSVLSRLAGTAATLQHLDCENIGEVPFLPFLANAVTKRFDTLWAKLSHLSIGRFTSHLSVAFRRRTSLTHCDSRQITECCLVKRLISFFTAVQLQCVICNCGDVHDNVYCSNSGRELTGPSCACSCGMAA